MGRMNLLYVCKISFEKKFPNLDYSLDASRVDGKFYLDVMNGKEIVERYEIGGDLRLNRVDGTTSKLLIALQEVQ